MSWLLFIAAMAAGVPVACFAAVGQGAKRI
jgi:hypothetical protein